MRNVVMRTHLRVSLEVRIVRALSLSPFVFIVVIVFAANPSARQANRLRSLTPQLIKSASGHRFQSCCLQSCQLGSANETSSRLVERSRRVDTTYRSITLELEAKQPLPLDLAVPRRCFEIYRIRARSHLQVASSECSDLFHAVALVRPRICGGNRMG